MKLRTARNKAKLVRNGLTLNAAKRRGRVKVRAPKLTRFDPTRTGKLREAFVKEIKRRFGRIKAILWDMVVRQDAFGLGKPKMVGNGLTVNPFVSEQQRKACYAKDDPDWDCDEWEGKTEGKLPKRKVTATANVAREDMPQIRKEHWDEFLAWVQTRTTLVEEHGVDPASLKAVQHEFSQERVDAIPLEKLRWPILTSEDGHVLDGNHRWIKALQTRTPLKVLRIGLPVAEALDLMRQFPKAEFVENSNDFFARCERDESGRCVAEGGGSVAEFMLGAHQSMVDSDGNPREMWHGTSKEFTEFRPSTDGAAGPGVYLSTSKGKAESFADKKGGKTLKVYANLKNPLRVPFNETINAKAWAERARNEGHDGLLIPGQGEVVVFDPKQVRIVPNESTTAASGVFLSNAVGRGGTVRGRSGPEGAVGTLRGEAARPSEGHRDSAGGDQRRPVANAGPWAWQSDPRKVKAFLQWLKRLYRQQLLEDRDEETGDDEDSYWYKFVDQGFRQGAGRAWDDYVKAHPELKRQPLDFYKGTRAEFLRSSFAQPESIDKIKLLAGRTYSDLKNVTEDMSARIVRELTEGLARGEHPNEIGKRISEVTDLGEARSKVIARHECLPADTLVDAAVVRAVFRRWYVGDMVHVKTRNGREFSATPNHPMLTQRGWVPAGQLETTDHLVSRRSKQDSGPLGNPDVQRNPLTLGEIFDSLQTVGIVERRVTAEPDFHGDGREGEVDVLCPDGELAVGDFAPIHQHLVENVFTEAGLATSSFCHHCGLLLSIQKQVCLCDAPDSDSAFNQPTLDHSGIYTNVASDGLACLPCQVPFDDAVNVQVGAQLVRHATEFPAQQGSGLTVSGRSCLPKNPADLLLIRPNGVRDLPLSHARQVEFDDVIAVSLRPFAGHVYNLETPYGYYTIQGLYTGNTATAHIEGKLLSFEQLGVEELGVAVEWSTSGREKCSQLPKGANKRGCVCPICEALEGIVVKTSEAHGMLPAHVGCLPGDVLVLSRERITSSTERLYDGDVVVFSTANGRVLTCTPNHPILTDLGWVAAGSLDVGSNVVCDGGSEWEALVHDEHQQVPTMIEEVAHSFWGSGKVLAAEVPTAAPDFHGDGSGSKVAVIRTNRQLPGADDLAKGEQRVQPLFVRGDPTVSEMVGLPGLRGQASLLEGFRPATGGLVGGGDMLAPLGDADALPPQGLSLEGVADLMSSSEDSNVNGTSRDAEGLGDLKARLSGQVSRDHGSVVDVLEPAGVVSVAQHPHDDLVGDAELARQLASGDAGPVFLDQVVSLIVKKFVGHVYNLETVVGYYSANGIITHNCYCDLVPSGVGESPAGQKRSYEAVKAATDEAEELGGKEWDIDEDRPEPLVNADALGYCWKCGRSVEADFCDSCQVGPSRIPAANFDPDQPRDEQGRWSSVGGSGSPPFRLITDEEYERVYEKATGFPDYKKFPVENVPLDKLVYTQSPRIHDQATVDKYAEELEKAGSIDSQGRSPPAAVESGGTYYILEGHHKASAYKKAGKTTIPMHVEHLDQTTTNAADLAYNALMEQAEHGRLLRLAANNCGTGAGGFQPGNTCGKGGQTDYRERALKMLDGLQRVGSAGTENDRGEWFRADAVAGNEVADSRTINRINDLAQEGYSAGDEEVNPQDLVFTQEVILAEELREMVDSGSIRMDSRVKVFEDEDGTRYLLDGHTRAVGAMLLEQETITARILKYEELEETTDNAAEAEYCELLALARNAFCPTGEGGGIDPTCSPNGAGKGRVSVITNIKEMVNLQAKLFLEAASSGKYGDTGREMAATFDEKKFKRNWNKTLKGLEADPEAAAKIQESVDTAYKEYDVPRVPVFIRKLTPEEKALGENAHWDNGFMVISDEVLGENRYRSEVRPLNHESKSTVKEAYPDMTAGMVVHELGHKFHDDNPHLTLQAQAMTLGGSKEERREISRRISSYAATHPQELIAEAYTMSKHPDYDKLPEETKALVNKVLGRK